MSEEFAQTWRRRQACARCRKFKVRCEYDSPQAAKCLRCTKAGTECSVDNVAPAKESNTSKRSLPKSSSDRDGNLLNGSSHPGSGQPPRPAPKEVHPDVNVTGNGVQQRESLKLVASLAAQVEPLPTPRYTDDERVARIRELKLIIERAKAGIGSLTSQMTMDPDRIILGGLDFTPSLAPTVDWNVPMIKRSGYLAAAIHNGLYGEQEIEQYFEASKDMVRLVFPHFPGKEDNRTAQEYAIEFPLLTVACITFVAVSQSKKMVSTRLKYLERLIGETIFLESAFTFELQAVAVVITVFLFPETDRKGHAYTLLTLAAGFVVDYANSKDVAIVCDKGAPSEAVQAAMTRVNDATALIAVIAAQSAIYSGWDIFHDSCPAESPMGLASFACGRFGGIIPAIQWCLEVLHFKNPQLLTIRQALAFFETRKSLGRVGHQRGNRTQLRNPSNSSLANDRTSSETLQDVMNLYENFVSDISGFQREKCPYYRPYDFNPDVTITSDASFPLILLTLHEQVMAKLMSLEGVDEQPLYSSQLVVSHCLLQTAEGILRAFHYVTSSSTTIPVSWYYASLTAIVALVRLRIVLWSLEAEVNFDVDSQFARLHERWENLAESSFLAFAALPDLSRIERWLSVRRAHDCATAESLASMSDEIPEWDTQPPVNTEMDWESTGNGACTGNPEDFVLVESGSCLRTRLKSIFKGGDDDSSSDELSVLVREMFAGATCGGHSKTEQ